MSENINYLCKITRSSFHMKFTCNFKNMNWWVLLPTQAGRIDSFLPGYSRRIRVLGEDVAGTAHSACLLAQILPTLSCAQKYF